jgi:hypothetical protein
MSKELTRYKAILLQAGLLASSIWLPTAVAQSAQGKGNSAVTPAPSPVSSPLRQKVSPYRSTGVSNRARNFYQLVWGVDSLSVKSVESGQLIRFSYHVIDAQKAKPLNDKKTNPYLIDEKARVRLVVPTLAKVGQLRQSSTPEEGKAYWMVFSNKGGFVKPGNRVSVVIGKFHVDGLVVQ